MQDVQASAGCVEVEFQELSKEQRMPAVKQLRQFVKSKLSPLQME